MKNDYICPYCQGKLNIKTNIVLSVRNEAQQRGLIFLSPKIGNYESATHPSFTIKEGEQLEIFCPICHANLKAIEFDKHLAKISMMDESQKVYEIVFSEIVGEHCTYKLVKHSIESYGKDKNQYMNFFGAKNRM